MASIATHVQARHAADVIKKQQKLSGTGDWFLGIRQRSPLRFGPRTSVSSRSLGAIVGRCWLGVRQVQQYFDMLSLVQIKQSRVEGTDTE